MTETETLLTAMLAVQAEAPTVTFDDTNPHFGSKFASLKKVTQTLKPILNKHGLIWTTLPTTTEQGEPALMYRLIHAATDQHITGTMPLLLSKQDAQGLGSAITYARRYSLCAVLNIVADDDDDGNAAASSAPAGRVAQSGPPSEKQLDYLKSLIGREKPSTDVLRALLGRVEADGVDPSVPGWSKALNKGQVSQLIETFKNGVVPVGGSDIPSDLDPVPDPGYDESPLPFDAVGAETEG